MFIEQFSNVTIDDTVFSGSTPGEIPLFGGAIFSDESNVMIRGCQVHSKYANVGGAIGISLSNLTVHRSCFYSNYAYEFGGALFLYNSSVSVNECDFEHNRAGSGGGAISTYKGILTVEAVSYTHLTLPTIYSV